MQTRWLVVLLITQQMGLPCAPAYAGEPTYKGKPASYWLDHFEAGPDEREESVAAFKAMGSNAVPFLVRVLESKPTSLGKAADRAVSGLEARIRVPEAVVKALPSADRTDDRRETAAFFISVVGPAAGAAIPSLLRILEDEREGWRLETEVLGALLAMGESGVAAVPRYMEYLRGDDDSRITGANLLASVGPKAKAASPLLFEASESTNGRLRWAAARALWSVDRQTNVALRTFVEGLQSTNDGTRQVALIYLREMGPAAHQAGSNIQVLLRDPDDRVRREAEEALQQINPSLLHSSQHEINSQTAAIVQKIVDAIQHGEFRDRIQALGVVGVLGPDAKAAVPALIEVLTGPGPQVPGGFASTALMNARREAAEALAEIGPEARSAVPALTALMRAGRDNNQVIYCRALGRIGADAIEAVGLLESALTNEHPGLRLAAAGALTRIVPQDCSNAVSVLKRLQHDPELATVWVLGKGGMAERSSQKDFESPSSRFFRSSASVPLWKLGLEGKPPVAAIIKELGKRDANEYDYVEMLGEIGPEAKPALPLLTKMLNPDRFIRLRRAAAIAIRKIDREEAAKLGLPGLLAVP